MIYKFPLTIFKGQVTKFDHDRYLRTRKGLPDGEWEVLIRKAIKWDTDQMRKYFHGPVLEFVEGCERNQGRSTSKAQLKIDIKTLYGPMEDAIVGTKKIQVLKSTGDYTFDEYKNFLNNINAFSMENYNCEIPPAEQVD
ncbi:hypothetical protein LCGC14_2966600 [marine sediment metagenome]|uniref:Uncharacterized protein n=1 Tax=marine sediment metagenome TaxID=412755 RepID=A0A0F8XBJ6_9ZZZZ